MATTNNDTATVGPSTATTDNEVELALPWLMEEPQKFLDSWNKTSTAQQPQGQSSPGYRTLTLRIFIFHKEEILLQRQGEDWKVPALQYRTGEGDRDDGCNSILQRIVIHLTQTNIPRDVLHELQFMDFSHDTPAAPTRFLTIPTPHAPDDELALSIVLTTSHPAHANQNVADSTQNSNLPQTKTLRWMRSGEDFEKVPLVSWIIDPINGVTPIQILAAHARLLTCKKDKLEDSKVGPRPPIRTICLSALLGIVMTQKLVDPTIEFFDAIFTVTKKPRKWSVEVIRAEKAEFDRVQMRKGYRHGNTALEDAGRCYWNSVLDVPDKPFEWLKLFDTRGRVGGGDEQDVASWGAYEMVLCECHGQQCFLLLVNMSCSETCNCLHLLTPATCIDFTHKPPHTKDSMDATAGTSHWLMLTPEQFLASYDKQKDGLQRCNSLAIRAFIFAKKSLLLVEHEEKFSDTQDQLTIQDEVLFHLNQYEGIPRSITRELQFMELSQQHPLITAYSKEANDESKSRQLSLSVILTTASDLLTKPLPSHFHWATQDEILTSDIPPLRPTHSKHFDLHYIARADKSFSECRKPTSSLTTETISQTLIAILNARYFAGTEPNLDNGWIALADSNSRRWSLGLFPANSKEESSRPGRIFEGAREYRVVGCWRGYGIFWRENVTTWGSVVDGEGRLRVNIVARGRVGWWVHFGEDA
ncbi:hypothetical protein M409DRAFT_54788 [Zasmidium cellare ATCC 36951]|uniref:Uncharacterized protein n=1 Tax=Zasmidium cellare ATCC 36951 TaxID=1080233 RepID=A0A6A6CL37_ZASCE|nr:uncharacterized protein M409DRAFT_54788 [Zasmidium cellare ATCC 36951]KAF2166439.1 hypothetical protein M409DRAFT_54788 [Zasmidium cellare ATCC 36951]